MEEIWKDIKGYEGLYQISNLGRVKSLDRISKGRKYKSKILSIQKNKNGYQTITLYDCSNYKGFTIHRLVALSFIPNPQNKKCVNHKDGNKENNKVTNLEWVTHSENMKHAFDKGLNFVTKENHITNVKNSIETNRKPVLRTGGSKKEAKYRSIAEASRHNKVNQSDITQVCKRKKKSAGGYCWSYINKEEF